MVESRDLEGNIKLDTDGQQSAPESVEEAQNNYGF